MKTEILNFPSFWKTETNVKYVQVEERNRKLVVLFPGKNYSYDKPTLHYAVLTAIQCGYDVLALEYGYQAARAELEHREIPQVIADCENIVRQMIANYQEVVFISKSLGTVVAGEVQRRLGANVRQVFLTPIRDSVPYILDSRCVVVYGTKDDMFPSEAAKSIMESEDRKVIAIPGAKHSLETGRVDESLEILRRLTGVYMDVLQGAHG